MNQSDSCEIYVYVDTQQAVLCMNTKRLYVYCCFAFPALCAEGNNSTRAPCW